MAIDSGAAPAFVGPEPPDASRMTYPELLKAALNHFANSNLSPEDKTATKMFLVSIQSLTQQKLQQQQGQLLPEDDTGGDDESAPSGGDENETEDYGTSPGTIPADQGL